MHAKRFEIVLSLAAATFLLVAALMGKTQADGVSVNFTGPRQPVTLHQPVLVEFSVTNRGAGPVLVDLGHNRKSGFEFVITEPDGIRVRVLRKQAEGLGMIGEIRLRSREVFRQTLLLNEWHAFTKPGEYSVEATLSTIPRTQSGITVEGALEGRFKVRVEPRDEAKLRRVCEGLAADAIRLTDFAPAQEATLALSHIQDPIVVPFLRRILEQREEMAYLVVPGLARIGNAEAVEALIVGLESPDEDSTDLARYQLTVLKDRLAKNPSLKAKVEGALAKSKRQRPDR